VIESALCSHTSSPVGIVCHLNFRRLRTACSCSNCHWPRICVLAELEPCFLDFALIEAATADDDQDKDDHEQSCCDENIQLVDTVNRVAGLCDLTVCLEALRFFVDWNDWNNLLDTEVKEGIGDDCLLPPPWLR